MKLTTFYRLILLASAIIAPRNGYAAIAEAPESVHPLAVGVAAPTAKLKSPDGNDSDLVGLFANRPTVLVFYRGGWCPYCNAHLAALGESYLELRKLGYQIVGVTPDSLDALKETAEKHQLLYKLASDRNMEAASAYGVAYRITEDTAKAYAENGINLSHIPGEKDSWLPVPAAFLIGADGKIKFVYFNPDPSIRITGAELLAAAKAALP